MILCFVSCSTGVNAQSGKVTKKAEKLREEGLAAIKNGDLYGAVTAFELALEESPNYTEVLYDLGLIEMDYMIPPNHSKAADLLERAYQSNPEYKKSLPFTVGKAYFLDMQYEKAREMLDIMLSDTEFDGRLRDEAELISKSIDFAKDAVANPVPFNPVNLGKNVNSPYTEMFPALTADDQMIFFTRSDFGVGGTEDIWFSYRDDAGDPWEKSINLGSPINQSRQNEGAHCISPDGKFLFFTICGSPNSMNGSCDIFYSTLKNGFWSAPKNCGPSINTGAWESQPSLSADSKALYFVSNRKGGQGESDIYVSYVEDGWFTDPINLGPTINTPYDEERPQFHTDNQTLYFSSKGHVGMGGFDLYVSRKNGDQGWSEPQNLGYPINTPGFENAIFVNNSGELALLASEREGGYGQTDIYEFEMPAAFRPLEVTYIKGMVYDEETKETLKANVQVIDLETGEVYVSTVSDDQTGFLLTIPTGKDYAYNVNKDGYLFYSRNFDYSESSPGDPIVEEIPLSPIKSGEVAVLRNVFFETGSFELLPASQVELNKLVELLEKNPDIRIEIGGHTDDVGDEADNQLLSENRAKSVTEYLTENGISADRLEFKGYGETDPIADNATEEGRALNRRTQFKVLD